ncbi:unnamed protein product [Fraxinus pennsylvanica]|uniref:Transposase MuDR plant domain-containing protein n=1 Tax=Fraxinus pennsylvanica TaxID=56036 RepID=A0AAD1ZWT1_9LAMI|nr:unnamed protein product [Fraxinus pennsylvanica]
MAEINLLLFVSAAFRSNISDILQLLYLYSSYSLTFAVDELIECILEELEIGSGSESEENIGKLSFPEFIPGKRNPKLEIGLLFGSFEELKSAVRNHVVFNRVESIFKRNDKERFHCVCKEGCPWKLWASKLQGQDTV